MIQFNMSGAVVSLDYVSEHKHVSTMSVMHEFKTKNHYSVLLRYTPVTYTHVDLQFAMAVIDPHDNLVENDDIIEDFDEVSFANAIDLKTVERMLNSIETR